MEEQFVVNERRGCLSGAACTIFSIFFSDFEEHTHINIFVAESLFDRGLQKTNYIDRMFEY